MLIGVKGKPVGAHFAGRDRPRDGGGTGRRRLHCHPPSTLGRV